MLPFESLWRLDPARPLTEAAPSQTPRLILSFDVEEHDRIEAAVGMSIPASLKAHYRERLDQSTRWLLDELAAAGACATFFIVGQIAEHNPDLIRDIARAGHEVASHGWDHRSVLRQTPESFRIDVRRSVDALEQITGTPVRGYRAPTFSVVERTGWALDVLAEAGLRYDSSIYPVHHDRYGVPTAPRTPFRARGNRHDLVELPPATLRLFGVNVPMGGGGHFRLWPLRFTEWAIRQSWCLCEPAVAMLYFHPWEFDPDQQQLTLGRVSRFRTYLGIGRTRARLRAILKKYRFARAWDVVRQLNGSDQDLASFALAPA